MPFSAGYGSGKDAVAGRPASSAIGGPNRVKASKVTTSNPGGARPTTKRRISAPR